MTSEFNQIINLVKSKNKNVENISYKEVYKLRLDPQNNNNTSIVFNTENNSSHLIDYSNAYFQFIFNIKFETGVDDDESKAIIIWRKKSNINLKINNNFLEVNKTY